MPSKIQAIRIPGEASGTVVWDAIFYKDTARKCKLILIGVMKSMIGGGGEAAFLE
jgi:hypothetical protein